MPSVQTMVSRKSSITNAFVNTIIPTIPPTNDEIAKSLTILGMEPDDVRCAYCGDKATEWDHLRPLVAKRRPTGFISEIANLVPACGKCNQSKGGSKVPLLGDVPLVGALFRNTSDSVSDSKLYVFVKANILRPEATLEGLSEIEKISERNRAAFEKNEEMFQKYDDVPGIKPTPVDPEKVLDAE